MALTVKQLMARAAKHPELSRLPPLMRAFRLAHELGQYCEQRGACGSHTRTVKREQIWLFGADGGPEVWIDRDGVLHEARAGSAQPRVVTPTRRW